MVRKPQAQAHSFSVFAHRNVFSYDICVNEAETSPQQIWHGACKEDVLLEQEL